MNNNTTNRTATAAASPLTAKEAPQPVMIKKTPFSLLWKMPERKISRKPGRWNGKESEPRPPGQASSRNW